MTQATTTTRPLDVEKFRRGALILRSLAGGTFMGLANLVPGISGGTMLLALGVYPQFIGGVAEISMLRFRPSVLLMLACVVASASIAIVSFAQLISVLLGQYQWAMYSVFIGLTLGGAPLLWRMLRPIDLTAFIAAAVAVALMTLLALTNPDRVGHNAVPGPAAYAMFAVAGGAGGAAMILPGLSGAYLLLILGQYRTIIDAVASAASGARIGDWAAAAQTLHVLVPVGVGLVLGVVGISNLVKRLLKNYERATLGFLLGLLLGAVVGLWPFFEPVAPQLGDVVRGTALTTAELLAAVNPEDYSSVAVVPSLAQVGAGTALLFTGFGISWGISRIGN